jgi:AraC-like DNA-binding protein
MVDLCELRRDLPEPDRVQPPDLLALELGVVRDDRQRRPARSLLRLQAALPGLAAGEPVGNVARRVGYESASAFVAAFRRETGVTPAAYFRATPVRPGGTG